MNKDKKISNQDINIEDSRAPLISHLIELRDRLKWAVVFFFISFCFCYYFATDIYKFLVAPLYDIYIEKGIENPRMIYTALTEAFFTFLKVSFASNPEWSEQTAIGLSPKRRVTLSL